MEKSYNLNINLGKLSQVKNLVDNFHNNFNNSFEPICIDSVDSNPTWKLINKPRYVFEDSPNLEESNNPNNWIPIRLKTEKTNHKYLNQIKSYLLKFTLNEPLNTKEKCIICLKSIQKNKYNKNDYKTNNGTNNGIDNETDYGNKSINQEPILKIQPCQHFFHNYCLENWIYEKWNQFENKEITFSCPLCRQPF